MKNHFTPLSLSLCLLVGIILLAITQSVIAGKIIRPWRATTAIIKQGETFEIWFDADSGQSVNTIDLRSKYKTVSNLSFSEVNGWWEYDMLSRNGYDKRITVTVPHATPADRYELVLHTSNGQETSTGAVKVIQEYKNEYYIAGTSCSHRYQNYDGDRDGDMDDDDHILILRKISEILKVCEIMDVEMFFEAGDNLYSITHPGAYYNAGRYPGRPGRSRTHEYFLGIEELGIWGVHDTSAATYMVPGNHDSLDNTVNSETAEELGQFWNQYWGMHYHAHAYGNARYLNINNGWGGGSKDPRGQTVRLRDWMDNGPGRGNFIVSILHMKQESTTDMYEVIPMDLSIVGHQHTASPLNPISIPYSGGWSPPIQYVSDSNKEATRFEFLLFKVNDSGSYTTPSDTTARVQVIQGDVYDQMRNDPSTWTKMLELNYVSNNNGSSYTNSATIINRHNFQIDNAKIRFVMPLGENYNISQGFVRQAFDGDNFHLVDVAVDVPANSSITVDINAGPPPPNNARFDTQTVPSYLNLGETTLVTVSMKNTGSDTWTAANGQSLGSQSPQDNQNWGASRVSLSHDVAPDETHAFNFNITAPTTPGLYDFRWKMVDDLAPELGWFGATSPSTQIQVGPPMIHLEAEQFNLNQGLQTESTTDVGGGQNVGWTDAGDYLEYNIDVIGGGTYQATFRLASVADGNKFRLKHGDTILAVINEPATGGFQNWVTSSSYVVDLPAGEITLTIEVIGSGWNMNWFEFQPIYNARPNIISPQPDGYVEVAMTYDYLFEASDADNDSLTLSAATLPSWLSFDAGSGQLSGVPETLDIGTHDVRLLVADAYTDRRLDFTITVSAPGNDAPVINHSQAGDAMDGNAYSYKVEASDADGDALVFSASKIPLWLSIDSESGVLSGTPTSNDVGLNLITINVTDGAIMVEQDLSLVVFEAVEADNLVKNASFEIGGANADDWNISLNHALDSQNSQGGSGRSLEISNALGGNTTQVVTVEPNTNYDVSVWIDASGMTAGNAVFDLNDQPTPETEVQFVINTSNAGWTEYSGSFNSATLTQISVRMFTFGTFAGSINFDNIVIRKQGITNASPVFSTQPLLFAEDGEAYVYRFSASDYEGDSLTFGVSNLPGWLSLNAGARTLSGTPSSTDVGVHSVSLYVHDGGVNVYQNYDIVVTANLTPVEIWMTENSVTDLDADDDNDGIVNLAEFALGGDPKRKDSESKRPELLRNSSGIGFEFYRGEGSLTYIVQKSTNLVDWFPYATNPGTVESDVIVPISSSEMDDGKIFLRLSIEE